MLNMSNQFYNYIVSLLVEYFNEIEIKAGDRYYLQLDNTEEVTHLITAMKNSQNSIPFNYRHEYGDEYETFAIPFKEHKLVVAHTSANVKPDYLVTLRN